MAKKTYKLTETQMEWIVSIVNCLIEKSSGCKNGEWSPDSNGMWMDENGKWGFMAGDDMEEDEEEINESLKWVFNQFIKEE